MYLMNCKTYYIFLRGPNYSKAVYNTVRFSFHNLVSICLSVSLIFFFLLTFLCILVTFPVPDKIPQQKQLNGDWAVLGSQVESISLEVKAQAVYSGENAAA